MPQPPIPVVAPGTVVGGLRLVRKLGDGRAAQVFLGYAPGPEQPITAAVKVYAAEHSQRAETEIQALSRAQGEHVVRLRDLAVASDGGTAIILERLELGSLAQLVENRPVLAPGEAVTILAPLARAVDALHQHGVAHGSLSPLRVLFRADGAPVIVGFASAQLHEPGLTPVRLALIETVRNDRVALAALSRLVLESVGGASSDRILAWLERVEQAGFTDPLGEELAERLFASAAPEPVRFDRRDHPSARSSVPSRVASSIRPMDDVSDESVPTENRSVRSRPAWLSSLHLPEWMEDAARESLDESPVARLRAGVLARLRVALGGVRRPVWIAAGAVAVALVVALVVVPDGTGKPEASVPDPTVTPTPIDDPTPGPVEGDDPVAALAVLLDQRERCLRDLSVLCLDGVLQAGSAAMARDAALIGAVQSGGELGPDAVVTSGEVTLLERLGDSALVSLGEVPESQPASTLLMKGEAGWRIRGYLN